MESDVNFMNSLYGQANEKPSKVLDKAFLTIILFLTIAIVWASFAYIDELTRGNGKVIPADKIQTIQSLDGGIISEILIKEGQTVKEGQALMKIDSTRFQASYEENQEQYLSLLAQESRLKAQLKYKPGSKARPRYNLELSKYPNYKETQTNIYQNKIAQYSSSLQTLNYQLHQKKQELQEALSKEEQLRDSLRLMRRQMNTISKLVRSGSKSNLDLLKIKSSYNNSSGDLKNTIILIKKAKLSIRESISKSTERKNEFIFNTSEELQETQSQLQSYKSRLVSDNDKLKKTIVRSPVNGTIKQIHINTIGGVVRSADNLIEIVPYSDILLVEAKIDPKDIAFINPTQKVIVKITAYDFAIYGGLSGNIIEISADSIKDKDSKENKSFYKIVVKTNKNYLLRHKKKLPIIPGMIASVDIVTGKKTIMDFILKPILKTQQGALHER